MYYCKDCKSFLEEHEVWTKDDPDTGCFESGCRKCGGDFIEEAHGCPICGQPTTEDFCEDCYEKVRLGLNELKDVLQAGQQQFEDIIANHFGW